MDNQSQVQPGQAPEAVPGGQSGEGAGSVMERLAQQERQRAAQRALEAGAPPGPAEPARPPLS